MTATIDLATMAAAGRTIYYRAGTSDEQVIKDVFDKQFHVPPRGSPPPTTILDLGCNIGLTMLHYEMMWPFAFVWGVEMDIDNAAVAARNTTEPIILAAVAAHDGVVSYSSAAEPWAYSILTPGERTVQARTLDSIRPGVRIDLLKMDIEGSEAMVLPAADLSRFQSVLVETHGDYTKPDAIRDLRAQGFECRADLRHDRAVYAWRP